VPDLAGRELHNRDQQRYFGRFVKPTMVPGSSAYLERHLDEVLQEARLAPGDRILEVGCGMGRYTLSLARRGYRVEGMDISQYLLDRLAEYNSGQAALPLHCMDVVAAPAEWAGTFDAVIALFTLHHVHDIEACLSAMARLTRPGGSVVLLEPNPFNPLYYLQIAFTRGMRWRSERGLLRMRPSVLLPALARAGLQDARLRRFGFFPPQVANRPGARRFERTLEAVPAWRVALPFQLFSAGRKSAGSRP
jgi:2-polyprenyl-3-methyl-5-hydroxy-6-metoxy-1,4-benzoquinol methylase